MLVFNGIDGSTGRYLRPPASLRDFLGEVLGHPPRLEDRKRRLRSGADPRSLASAGWGVAFASGTPPEIKEALKPLIEHRKALAASIDERRFRCLDLDVEEDHDVILGRHRVAPGPAVSEHLPYYLLLVGSPESISFDTQFRLGVARAVGRLHFETAEEYASYAEGVLRAESSVAPSEPRAALFAVCHDQTTEWCCKHLVQPLAEALGQRHPRWSVNCHPGDEARKDRILAHLGGSSTPNLVFTAGHGVSFPRGDHRQPTLQGALLCQDWGGPGEPLLRDHYLAAEDVGESMRPSGLISFHFACYGAGTPRQDRFVHRQCGAARLLSERPLVAPLAQRLLGHPRGGSLAFIGHVDRAWGYSFLWGGKGQAEPFISTLSEILGGLPVGEAMKFFSDRYGELATHLVQALLDERQGRPMPAEDLVAWWTSTQDAATYAILGDPAVRFPRASTESSVLD